MAIWLGKQRLGQREDPNGNDSFNGELREFIEFLKQKYGKNSKKATNPNERARQKTKTCHKTDPNKIFKM